MPELLFYEHTVSLSINAIAVLLNCYYGYMLHYVQINGIGPSIFTYSYVYLLQSNIIITSQSAQSNNIFASKYSYLQFCNKFSHR